MKTLCPHCKMLIPYSARLAGRTTTCPVCHTQFAMPSPDEQARLIAEEQSLRDDQQQRFERARQKRLMPSEEAGRYPALRFVAGLVQFLAVVVFFLAVVGIVAVSVSEMLWEVKVQWAVTLATAAVIGPVLLWGLGELIILFIDMANDMRATRQEIARLRRKKS